MIRGTYDGSPSSRGSPSVPLVTRAETPATLTSGVCRVSRTSLATSARATAPYAEGAPDLGHERHMSLTSTALLVKSKRHETQVKCEGEKKGARTMRRSSHLA